MDEPRLRIVTTRLYAIAAGGVLLLLLVAMVVTAARDKTDAFLCFGPLIPLAVVGLVAGVITQRVLHVDREGITAAWEPYGIVVLDLPRESMTMITVDQVERSFLDPNDLFGMGVSSVVSWSVHVHLRDGGHRAVLRGTDPSTAKRLADQLRAFLRL